MRVDGKSTQYDVHNDKRMRSGEDVTRGFYKKINE